MPKKIVSSTNKKAAATKRLVSKKIKAKTVSTVKAKKVSFMPKGYSNITSYLIVDKAAKAISFYEKAFGAKEVMRMDKSGGKIGHAELKIGDAKIMLADESPEMGAKGPEAFGGSAVCLHIYTKNVDETVKKALSLGAKLLRPIENTFYGDRGATIKDPFGHVWYVATHVEDVSKAMMKKRAIEAFKTK
jgi:PhnB protein